jgi:hypothetical protein
LVKAELAQGTSTPEASRLLAAASSAASLSHTRHLAEPEPYQASGSRCWWGSCRPAGGQRGALLAADRPEPNSRGPGRGLQRVNASSRPVRDPNPCAGRWPTRNSPAADAPAPFAILAPAAQWRPPSADEDSGQPSKRGASPAPGSVNVVRRRSRSPLSGCSLGNRAIGGTPRRPRLVFGEKHACQGRPGSTASATR